MLMQRSRANPMHAAGMWSHVYTVFGRNIRNCTAPMDSLALNRGMVRFHFWMFIDLTFSSTIG